MITYTWNIISLKAKPSLNGLQNVISEIKWEYTGTDEDNNTFSIEMPIQISDPNVEEFVPYGQVTESMVISWLENSLDVEAMQQAIEDKINKIKNPPLVSLPLPWNI